MTIPTIPQFEAAKNAYLNTLADGGDPDNALAAALTAAAWVWEPCPVCGSTIRDHEHKSKSNAEALYQEMVREADGLRAELAEFRNAAADEIGRREAVELGLMQAINKHCEEIERLKAALAPAAAEEAGEEDKWLWPSQGATIERCAQVAEEFGPDSPAEDIAARIRALKDAP